MRRTPVWVSICALALLASSTAYAGPTPSCPLLVDAAHDLIPPAGNGSNPRDTSSLDLVSSDVASDATHLTGVLRVRDLSQWRTQGTGVGYGFQFTVGRERFMLEGRTSTPREAINPLEDRGMVVAHDFFLLRSAGGDVGRESWRYIHRAEGYLDEDTSEIVMTAKLADLGLSARSHPDVTVVRAEAMEYDDALVVQGMHTVDYAASNRTYRLGSRGCVPVYHGERQVLHAPSRR